ALALLRLGLLDGGGVAALELRLAVEVLVVEVLLDAIDVGPVGALVALEVLLDLGERLELGRGVRPSPRADLLGRARLHGRRRRPPAGRRHPPAGRSAARSPRRPGRSPAATPAAWSAGTSSAASLVTSLAGALGGLLLQLRLALGAHLLHHVGEVHVERAALA